MRIIEIGTGYTEMPAKIGAATEIVAYNLYSEFKKTTGVTSEMIDVNFRKEKSNKSDTHDIYVPKYLKVVNDAGIVHVLRRLFYSLRLSVFLRSMLRKEEEELVLHFHNQFNFFIFFLLNKRLVKNKKIITAFTVHSSSWSFGGDVPKNLRLEKFSIENADIIIAITTTIKKNILLKINENAAHSKDNIYSIHNGVNIDTYFPIDNYIKKNQFINIGSICERKNQYETIVFLKEFLVDNNYRFVFAGKIIDQQYFQKITNYISDNNLSEFVEYLGEIEPGATLNTKYNESKAYISLSKGEAGLSLVVLEAMSAGLPVFLSESFNVSLIDFNPLPNTIIHVNEEMLILELKRIFIEQKVSLSDVSIISRRFIEQNLSWSAIATKHFNAFQETFTTKNSIS